MADHLRNAGSSALVLTCSGALVKNKIRYRLATHQVLRNDAIHIGWRHVVVPRAIGLHTHHWSAFAGGKATDTAAFDAQLALMHTGRLEFVTQTIEKCLRCAVLRATRPGAQQDVAFVDPNRGFLHLAHLGACADRFGPCLKARMAFGRVLLVRVILELHFLNY